MIGRTAHLAVRIMVKTRKIK